ncbi:uncharacterized protein V3H82_009548 [Fundulus diaphanus]
MLRRFLLGISLALLQRSFSSMEINCSTSSTRNGTIYSVPHFGDDSCEFYWSTISDLSLANRDEKVDDLVAASNFTFLQTYKCYEKIKYVLDCYVKGKKNATCSADCSQSAEVSKEPEPVSEGTRQYWLTAGISSVFFLLVVGIVYYRCPRREVNQDIEDRVSPA